MTDAQREHVRETAKGKVIADLYWEPCDGGYWVVEFEGGSEMCFNRFMVEVAEQSDGHHPRPRA